MNYLKILDIPGKEAAGNTTSLMSQKQTQEG